MNNSIIIAFTFLIIAFFGLGLSIGSKEINITIEKHCEKIAENMPYESIEECVMELTR